MQLSTEFIPSVVHTVGVEKFPKLLPIHKKKHVQKTLKWLAAEVTPDTNVLEFTIQEKLDGANARIYRVPGTSTLRVYSRSTLVGTVESHTKFTGDFRGLVEYVANNYTYFINRIPEDHMIFGEWLVKHTLQYPEDMYNKFYVFPAGEVNKEALLGTPHTNVLGHILIRLDLTDEDHKQVLEAIKYTVESTAKREMRPVEGVVLYLNRQPVFKFVPDRLAESSGTNKKVPNSNKKEFIFEEVSERTVEKRFYDTLDKLNINNVGEIPREKIKALVGTLLSLVWEDFVREILPDAILSRKNKGIKELNLGTLKNIVNDRVRTFLKEREIL